MHGCIQGKNIIWWNSWKVKVDHCCKRGLSEYENIGNTWYPTSPISTLNYFLEYDPSINQGYTNWTSLDNFYKLMQNIEFLWSWTVDMENTSQNIATIWEDHWDWVSQYMAWLMMEIYFIMNSPILWQMKQAPNSHNVKFLYIRRMQQMYPS